MHDFILYLCTAGFRENVCYILNNSRPREIFFMKGTADMLRADCIYMRYIPGDYAIVQGIKGGGCPGKSYYKKGRRITQQGFGWATSTVPSQYILYTKADDKRIAVDVGFYFKTEVGRLTERRRGIIEDNMPEQVNLVDKGSYYEVSDDDMYAWKQACGL